MTDLADFLLARIAEDEVAAVEAGADNWEVADKRKVRWVRNGGNAHGWVVIADLSTATAHIARWDPARVLAECEAKREIVDRLRHVDAGVLIMGGDMANYRSALLWAVRALAAPYASHPDYQKEWAV